MDEQKRGDGSSFPVMVKRLLSVLGLLVLLGAPLTASDWARYRVFVPNHAAAQRLADSSLNLFSDNITLGFTDVIVGPNDGKELFSLGLPAFFVQSLQAPDQRTYSQGSGDYRSEYLTFAQIIQKYEEWRLANPTWVTRQQVGTSWEGRPIWVYRLREPSTPVPVRSVILQGGIHAREWISPAVVMHLFNQLRQLAQTSILHRWLINEVEVCVFPVLNPDGYVYTWTTDRFWRKNRRNNGNSYGVDLNRNYSKGWGGAGSSGNPSSSTYRGPSPFSEPETQAVRNFAATLPNFVGFIDYHSYGQYILWPWGYTTNPPPDRDEFDRIGRALEQAVERPFGTDYRQGQTSTTLYLASGASNDWAYNDYGALGFAIELRDQGTYGFELPASQIRPTQDENYFAFETFLLELAR
jgi:murein tripeptide amidase MpaA